MEYWKPHGRIELCADELSSGRDWSLTSYPHETPVGAVLSSYAVKHLRAGIKGIVLLAPNKRFRENTLFIFLDGRRVEHVWWRRW